MPGYQAISTAAALVGDAARARAAARRSARRPPACRSRRALREARAGCPVRPRCAREAASPEELPGSPSTAIDGVGRRAPPRPRRAKPSVVSQHEVAAGGIGRRRRRPPRRAAGCRRATSACPRRCPRAACGPELVPGAGRERADDRDGPRAGRERQDVVAVLQQHERSRARPSAPPGAIRGVGNTASTRLASTSGSLEQAEAELDAQHAADRLVDGRLRHAPGPHLVGEVAVVEPGHHVHVDAGEDGLAGRLGAVGRDAVADELVDRRPVRHDEAVEAPLVAQHVGEEPRGSPSPARRSAR